MTSVDLNADLAEFDNATNTALLAQISSANICCGVHSGNPLLMHRTIEQARMMGVTTGAHPSYPDRADFGRTSMMRADAPQMTEDELAAVIRAQLATFAALNNGKIDYIKPHGALYNDAQVDGAVATVVALEAERYGAAVMGQPGTQMHRVTEALGLYYVAEVFADRAYNTDGTLVSRSNQFAVIHDPHTVAQRVLRMVTEGVVETIEGTDYAFAAVDSVCLHGDTDGALDLAAAVRDALTDAGVTVASPVAVSR